jgi:tRNA(Ile)-lysidine synthase
MVSSLNLDANWLAEALKQFPAQAEIKTWWLAYSGGVDSQVLLHLLAQLKSTHNLDLRAVYIDHGLQPQSAQWQQHCADCCAALAIPFQCISVTAKAARGESPEAAARQARYTALANLIEHNHCLLTAQHQDDQAETFLLQLFRSAGAAGLSAMPFYTPFAAGWHLRPLLNINQQNILDYAIENNLSWVEDPSNQQLKYDRNLLRHTVMPSLKKRWPSIARTISIAAQQQAENNVLIETLARQDLEKINARNNSLSIEDLQCLSAPQCRNVLRYWIKLQGFDIAPRRVMQQIMQQSFHGREDAQPEIKWSDAVVRRFKKRLYVLANIDHDASQVLPWRGDEILVIDALGVQLTMQQTTAVGLKPEVLEQMLRVRFRQGGEKIQPAGRVGQQSLKKLFQQASVPPWERSRIPLIYLNNELIAVAGYWIAEAYRAEKDSVAYWPEISESLKAKALVRK